MSGFGSGPAALAPHPWDQFGPPPPLSGEYPDNVIADGSLPADIVAHAIEYARLLRGADDKREEASELEIEAADLDRRASGLAESHLSDYEDLIEVISDDPFAVDDADDVLRAWKKASDAG